MDNYITNTSDKLYINNLNNIIKNLENYINTHNRFKNIKSEIEITDIKNYNGHIFLKVTTIGKMYSLNAIIFNNIYNAELKIGDKIKIDSSLKLYKYELKLTINSYSFIGIGHLNISFNKLKNDLEYLGYFKNKKKIYNNYNSIGIISSLNAAGLKDFIYTINLKSNNKKIYIYPSLMQGIKASLQIQNAFKIANEHNIAEILILIRGGGAKDDLECFNDKLVATSIFESTIPVVTGIGHQIDSTIADLTADKYFITPTAVAQNIITENIITIPQINNLILSIKNNFLNILNSYYEYITNNNILKYKCIYLNNINNHLDIHYDKYKHYFMQLNYYVQLKYKYIYNYEQRLFNNKNNLFDNLNLKFHKNQAFIINENINVFFTKYNETLLHLSKPKIMSINNNNIISSEQLIIGNQYKIQFIDGIKDIVIL
jgi:exodeoxyribonuclease VII large subunit